MHAICIRTIACCFILLWSHLAIASPERYETQRADGSTIYWTLDRPDSVDKTGIIVLAQGSGCLSVEHSPSIALARSIYADFAALTVEKYGVKPGDEPQDDYADCSIAFHEHHTITQRVNDYLQVIDLLRDKPWWNEQLVLLGGSEGGAAVAKLSAQTRVNAIILLSVGGGWTFGEIFRQATLDEMIRYSVPQEQWPDIDTAFDEARKNPQSSEIFSGSSYHFWADAIDQRAVDFMLDAQAPLLLIHGSSDVSVSVASARMAVDVFVKSGRCNLTYWEFTGYDHGMGDVAGNSRMKEVLTLSHAWLLQQLLSEKEALPCAR